MSIRGLEHYDDKPEAPEGTVWVCQADGVVVENLRFSDHVYWSVLCWKQKNDKGNYVAITAEELDALQGAQV